MQASTENPDYLIRPVEQHDWAEVEPLWTALYRHQREHGLLVDLPADAYHLWVTSLKPLLGRFAVLYIAEAKNELVGFVCAKLRTPPAYLGGETVGYIPEIFVAQTHRGKGIAGELLSRAQGWFAERGIRRFELQVLAANPEARDFYAHRGWQEELVQMVWLDPSQ